MDTQAEIISKKIDNLPKTLQDYVLDGSWTEKITEVSNSNSLTKAQEDALKAEVFLILVGVEKYSKAKENIQKNILAIESGKVLNVVNEIEEKIFSGIRLFLIQLEKNNGEKLDAKEENLSRVSVLSGIENPIPVKPVGPNPAGQNVVLDAQHNLPEGEKKVMISSAAVPSRGPMIGNFKANFTQATTIPIIPPQKTFTVPPKTSPPPIPTNLPTARPTPPAPVKYTVDPYREPAA